ncbi:MAG: GTPase [Promethearchaeota archaeon]
MSSNIGPEAQAAYQKYLDAASLEEKIRRLEEFLSLVPKHKATEKIVALNKSRLAKLKRELEVRKRSSSAAKVVSPFSIKKEGIQVILVSDYYNPGAGKTSILNYLTGAAKEKIGHFTSLPEVGVYFHDNIQFQIVDMPAIMEGASKGVGNGKEILSQIRASDLVCFCVDLSRDVKSQVDLLLSEFNNASIRINEQPPPIEIQKTGANKIQLFFLTSEAREQARMAEEIKEIIRENGIRNCIVKIYSKFSFSQLVDALNPSIVYLKAIILGTKGDLPHTSESFQILKDQYSHEFPIILGTSMEKNIFPENFGTIVLNFLDKIKIYTMNAGKVAEKPLVMNKNCTVKDVALRIHRSFYELFDHAILIREGSQQKKKRVGLEYSLQNNDIIEIHTI